MVRGISVLCLNIIPGLSIVYQLRVFRGNMLIHVSWYFQALVQIHIQVYLINMKTRLSPSNRTSLISITKSDHLTLFRELTAVYCENNTAIAKYTV